VYTLHLGERGTAAGAGAGDSTLAFAVNVDPRESDLAAINPGRLPGGAVARAPSTGGLLPLAGAVPLERWLLFAVAALVLLELTAAWALERGWA
jgi:hypothetical protein